MPAKDHLKDALKKGLKPPTNTKMGFLPDGTVGGLGVIWGAKVKPSWTLAYRDVAGKQHRLKLGFVWTGKPGEEPTPEWLSIEAARWNAYQIKQSARQGTLPPITRGPSRAPISFGKAVDRYLEDPNTRALRTVNQTERILKRDAAPLFDRALVAITKGDIRGALEPKGATPSANRLHTVLSAFFTWAMEKDLVTVSPMPNGRPLKKEVPRDRVLKDDELARVWRATEQRPVVKRGIVQLLILTGQRVEEVAGMRWSELDLKVRTWDVNPERYKTKTPHLLPLTDAMLEIIKAQHRMEGSDFVFTINGRNSVSMSQEGNRDLKPLVGELPGGNWTLHDLRRTARTGWSKLGIRREIRELLIHPKTGVEGTYDRYEAIDEKRVALEGWGEHVLAIVAD